MYARAICPRVLAALADTPVVFLQGPRQCGKTTLVRELLDEPVERHYLTLDDATVLAAAAEPEDLLAGLRGPVALDEVQRAPGLLAALKAVVDRGRRPGRFLLTGSANALLLPQLAERLVGRMEVVELGPLAQSELERTPGEFVDWSFGPLATPPALGARSPRGLAERLLTGGFPEAFSRRGERRRDWFGSYITTLLQRDVRDLARIEGLVELPRLLALLAARTGTLLNLSAVSRDLEMAQTTLKRYLALLRATFLIDLLPAWSANLGKRLVKSPKLYAGETGVAGKLIGLEDRIAAGDPRWGPLVETFVVAEIRKLASWSRTRPSLWHYRTHRREEIDLLLEDHGGRLVAIEIKASAAVRASAFSSMRRLEQTLPDRFHRGIVLYLGDEVVPFGERQQAVPLTALWGGRRGPAGGRKRAG